jgi:hypothetical protein
VYLSSRKRKRHQRAINKVVRELNKQIENDSLWRGRFVVRQIRSNFTTFEDGSGAVLVAILRFYDKKTGITDDIYVDSFAFTMWGGSRVFWVMNEFIVNTCDVWNSKNEDPRKDNTDYRTIKI